MPHGVLPSYLHSWTLSRICTRFSVLGQFFLPTIPCLLLTQSLTPPTLLSVLLNDRAWHPGYHVPCSIAHPIFCLRCVPVQYLTSQVSLVCYWSLSCHPASAICYLFWSDCVIHDVYLLFYMSGLTCKANSKPAASSKERDSTQVMIICIVDCHLFSWNCVDRISFSFFFSFFFVAVACADCLSHDLQHIVKQLC